MKTNIAAKFLGMIKRHFSKSHPLYKIFNRNTLKVSYSTTRNIVKHIAKHNNKVLNKSKPEHETKECNCRISDNCPLRGKCQEGPIVYEAEIKTDTTLKKYIGSTGGPFKTRYNSHKHSINNRNANSTTLSTYIWSLKDTGKEFDITWKIKAKTGVYSAGSKYCDLYLSEKTLIMLANLNESLNARTEILNKCRHLAKFTLEKF